MEVWKKIKNFSNYSVSSYGQIRNDKFNRILTLTVSHNGYYKTTLSKKARPFQFFVHRVVAENFIGEVPKGFQVNHIDFDRKNNNLSNLEIITVSENRFHSMKANRIKYEGGENHTAAKLTEVQVIQIIENLNKNIFEHVIAEKFNVTRSCIALIKQKRTWKHLSHLLEKK